MTTDFLYEPPVAERTTGFSQGHTSNPLEHTTLETLLRGGLPVNVSHLKHIQHNLAAGLYQTDREKLIAEIKRDPALFIFCARETRVLSGGGNHPADVFHVLRTVPLEKLSNLFRMQLSAISHHSLSHANIIQASALQHMLLSVVAAEVLSSVLKIMPDWAYTSVAFHELGEALLVWNYGEIHARVLSNHRRFGAEIDAEWIRILGTTPAKIGIAFADEWSMHPDIRFALRQHGHQKSEIMEVTEGKEPALHELNEIADLYAQLHDPAHYPDGRKRWLSDREKIEQLFGKDIVERIDQKAGDLLSLFLEEVPALDKLSYAHSLKVEVQEKPSISCSFPPNSFVSHCPEKLHPFFHKIYDLVGRENVGLQAIKILVEELFPQSGFECGCLYLLDRHSQELHAALRFGNSNLNQFAAHSASGNNDFGASLGSTVPYRSNTIGVKGNTVERIVGGLASPHHPGVLYLEMRPSASAGNEPIQIFQAIRATLDDIFS